MEYSAVIQKNEETTWMGLFLKYILQWKILVTDSYYANVYIYSLTYIHIHLKKQLWQAFNIFILLPYFQLHHYGAQISLIRRPKFIKLWNIYTRNRKAIPIISHVARNSCIILIFKWQWWVKWFHVWQTIYIKYTLKVSQVYKISLLIILLWVNSLKLPQFYDIILLRLNFNSS